ncbi:gp33 family protein [Paenibacillus phocaensis]|uniref:gp33 family protein n=1 Tax=Paenibacillus phocaensis TaxID=1776378 RepID=UPI0003A891B5|nr:hypothetical protein [Paenibacillus phocaensis]
MEQKVRRYHELKQMQKETEQELAALREDILEHLREQGISELDVEGYRVRTIHQERKEYDDHKLYEALPDPGVWRLISKTDAQKVAGLVKLNVIPEDKLRDTFTVKSITLLQVDKK